MFYLNGPLPFCNDACPSLASMIWSCPGSRCSRQCLRQWPGLGTRASEAHRKLGPRRSRSPETSRSGWVPRDGGRKIPENLIQIKIDQYLHIWQCFSKLSVPLSESKIPHKVCENSTTFLILVKFYNWVCCQIIFWCWACHQLKNSF